MMSIRVLCLLACVVLFYLFVEINGRPPESVFRTKPKSINKPLNLPAPDPNVIQEMKKFKLEILKNKILKEINLSEPPLVQTPVHVPKNMLALLGKTVDEENETDDEELILYPFNDDFECIGFNETSCSRFDFQLPPENKTIPSIHVWFHKLSLNKSLFVAVGFCSSNEEIDRSCERQEVLSEIKTEFGWSIFKIPTKLSQLNEKILSVEAYGQNFDIYGDKKPFIVVDISSSTLERKRRSTRTVTGKTCTQQCCKIDFYISFKEIGWHFVVAPAGFHANMCYGKCSNDQLNAFPSHYHRTMNLALANKTTMVEKKEHVWTPCCSPTNLKPLSMIYKAANDTSANSTHTLVHHEIPDMIAESCGCW